VVRRTRAVRLRKAPLMADRRQLHLVSYDIRSPRRWRRAYRIIRGYGERLQYSVFRVRATSLQMARLRWELSRVLTSEDALLTVRLCPTCAAHIGARNDEDNWPAFHDVCKIVG
jgi:CRISPR-associated protein Cas2